MILITAILVTASAALVYALHRLFWNAPVRLPDPVSVNHHAREAFSRRSE